MLYDLTAIDERMRMHREGQPPSDFTVVYHLLSFERNEYVRIKVALAEGRLSLPTITHLWPAANWYEREVWDMFGITFDGHPHLAANPDAPQLEGASAAQGAPGARDRDGAVPVVPRKGGRRAGGASVPSGGVGHAPGARRPDFMFLNIGPQHPGTHGVLRIVLQLDGEEIVDAIPEIGFHHRGAEKMGERQSWHTYIPYTDRIDYLGGVMNNLAYLTAVEKLAGIEVPPRAQVIRVMLCELFRIISHLVWYGTFAQDLGQMSPVFFTFNDRERAFGIVEAITGARMHPAWFRIGGVAADLPNGWDKMFRDFIDYLPKRLLEYDRTIMRNTIFKARTQGIGAFTVDEAIEWGVTGANLRACGLEWDFRKKQPYSGYEQFEFDIPTAKHGDCYDRAARAHRGNAPEPAHHRAVREQHARRSVQVGPPPGHPAREGAHDARHRDADHPLSGRELGTGDAAGRSARRDRGHQGEQRLLPGERRKHDLVPHPHPHALVCAHPDAAAARAGTDDFGPGRDSGQPGLRPGRRRPVRIERC